MSPMNPSFDPARTSTHPETAEVGGGVVSLDGRTLALRESELRVQAQAGLARVVVAQRFANAHAEPLQVVYRLPLPADAAISGFAFTIGERRVVGEVDRRARARERYEEAIADGRSAGILDQERSSVFTQEIGNVPPGVEIVAELTLDQPLAWCDEGAWEWRFPTLITPPYLGASGRVNDPGNVRVDVVSPDAAQPALRSRLALSIRDAIVDGAAPTSSTHRITSHGVHDDARAAEAGASTRVAWQVAFADDSALALDRDIAVRWGVARPEPGVSLVVGRPDASRPHARDAYGLLTIVPPAAGHALRAHSRDVVLLLDVSGSMSGMPIGILQRLSTGVVKSLAPGDRLEMVAFASHPERWRATPISLDEGARVDALAWIAKLEAGGGTEMHAAIRAALEPLRWDAQRQVIVITDGAIGFEHEIVGELYRSRPPHTRVHVAAVGAAPNRTLSRGASRAGRGVELIVETEQEVPRAVATLLARTVAPALTQLAIEGEALIERAPELPPDLFAGAPVRLALRLRPDGGRVVVRGETAAGSWSTSLEIPAVEAGSGDAAVVALFGRERVEDLEAIHACQQLAERDPRWVEERFDTRGEIERIGVEFQIATQFTSWVAISEQRDVDPRRPTRRERIPQRLPYGTSAEGLGLRGATSHGSQPRLVACMEETWLSEMCASRSFDRKTGYPRSAPQTPSFRVRDVRRIGDGCVILLEAIDACLWEAHDEVTIETEAARIVVRVDRERSTETGAIAAGALIRLVLDASALPQHASLRTLLIEHSGGEELVIDLGVQ